MSESGDGGPGRREVAHRIFAAEFEDAEFSYSESDEERAPNYVVTPTGARVNRLFVVGVLTELEQVNDDVLRARIVDPTGPFVVYAGQYQPEALAFLEAATPPLFVAVTGKARTFEPDDGDRVFTSVRPESISEVDAETRDRWVVQAVEQTVARVGRMASAGQSALSGDALRSALVDAGVTESDAAGATLALDYYETTGDYLQAVRDQALNAARVVAGERDEAGSLSLGPGDGTDDPLSALATMDLAAPSESPSVEPEDGEPVAADDSVTTDSSDPTTEAAASTITAGTETAEQTATADETAEQTAPAEEASEPTTAEAESDEPTTDAEPSTVGASATSETDEPTDSTETEPATEAPSETTTVATEPDEPAEQPTEPESAAAETEPASTEDVADSSGTLGDFDSGGSDDVGDFDDSGSDDIGNFDETGTNDDVGEFDTEFELDEAEREEIEAEYGTDFQSGTEVDDAGEADIETPDPEELAEAEAAAGDEVADAGTDTDAAAVEESGDTEAADTAATNDPGADAAEDVDLEDAVMAAMKELDSGTGADREAVVEAVVETYGADPAAVEDAIQDALMGGRCYEPDDGKLTPI